MWDQFTTGGVEPEYIFITLPGLDIRAPPCIQPAQTLGYIRVIGIQFKHRNEESLRRVMHARDVDRSSAEILLDNCDGRVGSILASKRSASGEIHASPSPRQVDNVLGGAT